MILFALLLPVISAIEIRQVPAGGLPPQPIDYHNAVYDSNKKNMLFFGGLYASNIYNDQVWSYNVDEDKWEQVFTISQIIPSARLNCAVFIDESNRLMYIFGGRSKRGLMNDIWSFNLDSLTWNEILVNGPKPQMIEGFAYDQYQDDNGDWWWIVWGGNNDTGISNTVYTYNVPKNQWTLHENLGENIPPERQQFSGVEHEGYFYIFGGDDAFLFPVPPDLYRFHIETSTWELMEPTGGPPMSRSFYKACKYNGVFYVLYGFVAELAGDVDDIWKYDFAENTWTNWAINRSLVYIDLVLRDAHCIVVVDNHMYIHGGLSRNGLRNDIYKADLTTSTLTWVLLQRHMQNPEPRSYHSFDRIANQAYLFGGNYAKKILGDFWIFDIEQELWSQVFGQGKLPANRTMHASTVFGVNLWISGGQGAAQMYDDVYIYNLLNNSWKKLAVRSVLHPPPLVGHCIVADEKYMYLFGGLGEREYSNMLWKYDRGTETYTILNEGVGVAPPPMQFHKCRMELEDGIGHRILTSQGEGEGGDPIGRTYVYDIDNNEWTLIAGEGNRSLAKSQNTSEQVGMEAILTGGLRWGLTTFKDIEAVNLRDGSLRHLGELPTFMSGHSSFYYKNTMVLFGGNAQHGRTVFSDSAVNIMYKIYLEGFACSSGSIFNEETQECDACPGGSYSPGFSATTSCIECPPGTSSPSKAASSSQHCNPCQSGTFSDTFGSVFCKDCELGSICKVGSNLPSFSPKDSEELHDDETTEQPDVLQSNQGKINALNAIYYIVWAWVVAFTLVAIYLSASAKKNIKQLDQYKHLHNHILEIPMTLTKTQMGGLFSVIFFITVVVIIATNITLFQYDNLEEKKALVPWIVIADQYDKFEADLYASLQFRLYPGECVGENGSCHQDISVTQSNINGDIHSPKCEKYGTTCEIVLECTAWEIERESTFSIVLNEVDSYTSQIAYNVTASSSIPDENSSLASSVSAVGTQIFRGPEETQIPIIMTPSVYRTVPETERLTGYHVNKEKAVIIGSQQGNDQIYTTSGLRVSILIEVSEYALETLHSQKQNAGAFVGALAGSIVALMALFGAIMKAIEGQIYKAKHNQQLRTNKRNKKVLVARLTTLLDTLPRDDKKPPIVVAQKREFGSRDASLEFSDETPEDSQMRPSQDPEFVGQYELENN